MAKRMEIQPTFAVISILAIIISSPTSTASIIPTHPQTFIHCFSHHSPPLSTNLSHLLYFPNTTSYSSLLLSSIYNLRFASTSTSSPLVIVAPTDESHVRATVLCSRALGLHLRVRSGGHDYEGLSYRSFNQNPFVMLDLANFRSVTVDLVHGTALVQAGATLGELYYKIAEKSPVHGFPAGICPSVGAGGHISGGGMGNLVRKYGLAADNVLDVKLVDVNGRVLDRESMGEDLFWAIRGGGGASFGIILSWKVKLVPVTPTVAVFTMQKTLEDGVLDLLDKWQRIASKLDENVYMEAAIRAPMSNGSRGVEALFNFQFMGGCEELLGIMEEKFPELGVEAKDCKEMSWIQSVMYYGGFRNGEPLERLMNRSVSRVYLKGKSDFVDEPIPRDGWKGIWDKFVGVSGRSLLMYMAPYGGRMDEIPESASPFPHRKGNLYNIQYLVGWFKDGVEESEESLRVIRSLYKHMRGYVSKHPRAAYLNFRDLDLGMNVDGTASYSAAKVWGKHYFKSNFERLALVKGIVDPENFFRNEQSIPPLGRPE